MLITKKNILALGKDFVQEMNGAAIYAEKLYPSKKILFELALQWSKQLLIC